MAAPTYITWQSTKDDLNICRHANGQIDFDRYRRDKLAAVEKHTGIPLVVYATDFLNITKVRLCDGQVSIDPTDLQGFDEVTKDLPDGPLDILLHSPGGIPEAAESIVQVIRSRFNPVRFLVPVIAKSAATMIALSRNEILMPPSAELGPIDPQFNLSDGAGSRMQTPGQVLIDQFQQAQREIQNDPRLAPAWAPILQRYGVGLYQMAMNAMQLSKQLAHDWLTNYMLAGQPNAPQTAQTIVDYLCDHNAFKSHGRRVTLGDLQQHGVVAKDIRNDAALWKTVEEAWYAVQHTFEGTGTFKLFENSRRRAFIRLVQVAIQVPTPIPGQGHP